MKNNLAALFLVALLGTTLISISPAMAYIGPGLGVVAIWSLLGPIAGVISLILLIAYFPARYYYKKHKHKKAQAENGEDDDDADDKAEDAPSEEENDDKK